jgi:type VI secretion system secreted protein VgrG
MARLTELTTPLKGKDPLLFRELRGREELGRLSTFELSALSLRADISPGDLLGKNITVKLELRGGGFRYFNGYVTRFAQSGMVFRYHQYLMTVHSWPWFLTRTADCRIFQGKTVPEIIKEVFADHSMTLFEDGLNGTYPKREYCVQYRETDFDFVSRLMEEEGIYYFFEHQDGRHTLKLVNAYSGHKALENKASIAYYPPGRAVRTDEEYIQAWSFAQGIQPGAVALEDYDFTKPRADLKVTAKQVQKQTPADYEVFDYPGEYLETPDGEKLVRTRVDELHAAFERAEAECNVREVAVGRLFTFTNSPRRDQEREYLIVSADYEIREHAYESAAPGAEGTTYHCKFNALQSRQQFRPLRTTPRPIVRGPQTALVVGPSGEEIWCDKYGRVKVQFHWDRYGKKDENSSCWIRVSNPWAGATWGAVALPRIGQEVVVDFLEGDPDQPLITGRVYNADQMPPYALPANATQTGIKSRSSKGGGGANFNELRFEDKKGSEQVFLHAEKDQDIEVEHDETHWVGHDRKKTVDNDENVEVKHNRTEKVGVDESITIGSNRTENVGSNESITIGANRTESVGGNETITIAVARTEVVGAAETITIGAARTEIVGGAETITIGGLRTEIVGGAETITIGRSRTESVGAAETISVKGARTLSVGGDETISVKGNEGVTVGGDRSASITGDDGLSVGKSLTITATDTITITVGSASISMKKDGTITIEGKNISIIGSGEIVAKASKDMTLKAKNILQN